MGKPYFFQGKLWDVFDLDRELAPGLREVRDFLEVLGECDQELISALETERANGRDDYPVRAMWRLMAVQLFLRKGLFSDLLGELRRNKDLARLLRFNEPLPGEFLQPPAHVLSRFHAKLKQEKYQLMIKKIHAKTVYLLRQEDSTIGEHAAGDSTDIRTHGHSVRREGKEEEKPATDPEASWSVKTKRWEDAEGRKREETKSTFGYKAFLWVDVVQPSVLALETTTGSVNDQTMAQPMLEATLENVGKGTLKTCAMDKGFDSSETVREAHGQGVAAIVPVRDVKEELQAQAHEDREVLLKQGGNIVWDRYSGEVACYAPGEAGQTLRREMKYAGFEQDRGTHKFRCPLGAGALSCSAFSTCSAGSSGKQGRQIRVPSKTDTRRFAPIYPRSKHWKRLYNGRSAVERVNSYLKEVLRLEQHSLRGKQAIGLRVLMASVTLNLRTLLAIRAAKQEKAAA